METKKCLVIGGAGFIGMNIVKELAEKGNYNITIGDNFSRGKKDEYLNSIIEKNNIKVVSADFTEPSSFYELESDCLDKIFIITKGM